MCHNEQWNLCCVLQAGLHVLMKALGSKTVACGLPFSSVGWPTFAVCRNIPLKEEENFSTLIAIAFTVPLVLVASGLAGGESSSLQSCRSNQSVGQYRG